MTNNIITIPINNMNNKIANIFANSTTNELDHNIAAILASDNINNEILTNRLHTSS